MKSCESCAHIMSRSNYNPTIEQIQEFGNPESKLCCDICKKLMTKHVQLRQTSDATGKVLLNSFERIVKQDYNRFDV